MSTYNTTCKQVRSIMLPLAEMPSALMRPLLIARNLHDVQLKSTAYLLFASTSVGRDFSRLLHSHTSACQHPLHALCAALHAISDLAETSSPLSVLPTQSLSKMQDCAIFQDSDSPATGTPRAVLPLQQAAEGDNDGHGSRFTVQVVIGRQNGTRATLLSMSGSTLSLPSHSLEPPCPCQARPTLGITTFEAVCMPPLKRLQNNASRECLPLAWPGQPQYNPDAVPARLPNCDTSQASCRMFTTESVACTSCHSRPDGSL